MTDEATRSSEAIFEALVAGDIDPAAFSHRDHVAAAVGALRRLPFLDALAQYGSGLKRLTEKAGAPEKFNVTVTAAFMGLIAQEIRSGAADESTDELLTRAPHLLDRAVLTRWWSEGELQSPAARDALLLPTTLAAKAD